MEVKVTVNQRAAPSELVRKLKINLINKINLDNAHDINKHRHNLKEILENSNATLVRDYGDTGYACYFCSDHYKLPSELKKHNLDQHCVIVNEKHLCGELHSLCIKLDITDLVCKICKESISSIENLIEHLYKIHSRKIILGLQSHILPLKFKSDNTLQCCICQNDFIKLQPLLIHMNTHFRNYICNICESGFINKRRLNVHMRCHKMGTYKCDICSKVFNTLTKKRNHEKQVHEKSMFVARCGYCKEVFKSKVQKQKHLTEEHGVATVPRHCRACDKVFSSTGSLLVHMKRAHMVQRPHECQECDKSFFSRSELKGHMIKHTGKREFKCEVCQKLYTKKWTLSEHMRIHANDKRFKCEHCGQAFVQKCSLQGHMRAKHGEHCLN